MKIRKIIFWTHLVAGVLAGIVILIMSFTGVCLAPGYRRFFGKKKPVAP